VGSRQVRINRSITKYGANVLLTYRADLPAVQGDWPDPNSAPAPATLSVKAILVPVADIEGHVITEPGVEEIERVTGFFMAALDLNNVALVTWQGNTYRIESQDAYEIAGEILAQSTTLVRQTAASVFPHA